MTITLLLSYIFTGWRDGRRAILNQPYARIIFTSWAPHPLSNFKNLHTFRFHSSNGIALNFFMSGMFTNIG